MVLRPLRAIAQAAARPTRPPPTTTASARAARLIWRFRRSAPGRGGAVASSILGYCPRGLTPAASMNQPCATALTADAHPGGPAGRTELLPVRLPTSGVAF